MVVNIYPLSNYLDLDCIDTEQWENAIGMNCNYYAKEICENGAAKAGKEFALGENNNYPEINCCACRGSKSEGNVISFLCYNHQTLIIKIVIYIMPITY